MNVVLKIGLLVAIGAGPLANAQEDVLNYDEIIADLKGTSTTSHSQPDPFSQVAIHFGLGLSSSYISLRPESGPGRDGFLNGIEANIGIDLFSRYWQAEGSARSFEPDRIAGDTKTSLREFDLKILYTEPLTSRIKFQVGGGLAARYLDIESPYTEKAEYETPASILSARLRLRMMRILEIGLESSFRNSIIDDTIDRSALNFALRLDAEF